MRMVWKQYAAYFIKEIEITISVFWIYLLLSCTLLFLRYIFYRVKNPRKDYPYKSILVIKKEKLVNSWNEKDMRAFNEVIAVALIFIYGGCRMIFTCLQERTFFYFIVFLIFNIITISSFLRLFCFAKCKYEYQRKLRQLYRTYQEKKSKSDMVCVKEENKTQSDVTAVPKMQIKDTILLFLLFAVFLIIAIFLFFTMLPCIFFTIVGYGIVNMVTKLTFV